jgi:hypothetical protein
MAPSLDTGDLVVVRPDPPYQPGDVVAYRQPGGDAAIVVHRVVATDGDRLVLQGDANDTVDAVRPDSDDVIGAQVVAIPHVGRLLGMLQSPFLVAVLATGAAAAGFAAMQGGVVRRRRSGDMADPASELEHGDPETAATRTDEGAASDDPVARLAVRRPGPPWLWALLTVPILLAAVGVLRAPTDTSRSGDTPWTVTTSFNWEQPANGNAQVISVHGEDGIQTGDSVFAPVTPILVVKVRSQLLPAEGLAPTGSSLEVTTSVASDAGWRREIGPSVSTPLATGEAVATVPLDLASIWEAALDSSAVAGRQGEIRLELVAVTDSGSGGVVATATQAFVLDGVAATPEPPVAAVGPPGAPGRPQGGALPPDPAPELTSNSAPAVGSVTASGVVPSSVATEPEVTIGPLTLPRNVALLAVGIGLLVVAIGWLTAMRSTARAQQLGEATLLATRHRRALVPLRAAPPGTTPPIDVATFTALERVASTTGQPIGMSGSGTRGADFWVTDGLRSWRYRVPSL